MKIDPALKQDLRDYLKSRVKAQEQAHVVVIAPYKLTADEIKLLKQKLPMLSDAKIEQEVDPDLMAGVVIRFGSSMIDLSLQSQLHKLEKTLYETV